MPSAAVLRVQIEAALASRVPSALTPAPRILRAVSPTGVDAVDELLEGGLPLGAITEMVGPECSGRTTLALSFLAQITQTGKVCAWIDVSNALHPECAAASGVDLLRLLWVRCGVSAVGCAVAERQTGFVLPDRYNVPPPIKQGLHGGGFGPHPRSEAKGLSTAVGGLLRPSAIAPRCAEPQRRELREQQRSEPVVFRPAKRFARPGSPGKPWSRIEQALRVTDLLLQAGGFSAIVLDMGGVAPEFVSRVPLATWFRYRAAAERTQAGILLLTQHPCAKSSAGLVVRLQTDGPLQEERTVFTGIEHRVEVSRQRFTQTAKIVPMRKPPQRATGAAWNSRTAWAGR